jgi:hypothetical protein
MMGVLTPWKTYATPETVTTYMTDPEHPYARIVQSFVTTPDGVQVFACAVPRDPARRPSFRGIVEVCR